MPISLNGFIVFSMTLSVSCFWLVFKLIPALSSVVTSSDLTFVKVLLKILCMPSMIPFKAVYM